MRHITHHEATVLDTGRIRVTNHDPTPREGSWKYTQIRPMKIQSKDPILLANAATFLFQFFINEARPEMLREQITSAQLELLLFISNSEEDPTMSELARHAGHSTAAATGGADRLEKLGFIERFHATEDRRKVRVRLTKKGSDFITSAKVRCGTRLAAVLAEPRTTNEQGLQDSILALAVA